MTDQGLNCLPEPIVRFGIEFAVVGIILLLLLKWFLPAYLNAKGRNFATREDFNKLLEQVKRTTEETESIKSELARRHWLNQQQWIIRESHYTDLLSDLTKLRLSLEDRSNYYMEPGSERDAGRTENQHFRELCRVGQESLGAVREQIGPASVFLSDKTIAALETLVHEHWNVAEFSVCTADYISSALQLVDTAYSAVLSEARAELAHGRRGA